MATDVWVNRLQSQFDDDGSGQPTDRILIPNLTWTDFEALCDEIAERRWRIAYLHGVAEIMSPGMKHEFRNTILSRMVETLTDELDIPLKEMGSTRVGRQELERAVEADEAYYVAQAERLPNLLDYDAEAMPAPDLVLEVIVTSPLLDKLAIYAGLGVPEIWRHNKRGLTVLLLNADGRYSESPTSLAFSWLPMAAFAAKLHEYTTGNDTRWKRSFRLWVRQVVASLDQP